VMSRWAEPFSLSLSILERALMTSAPLAGSPQGAHPVRRQRLMINACIYPKQISGPLSNVEVSGFRRGCRTWPSHG
jgi:hypothetical protein